MAREVLNLSNVTLLCVETREPELAHWSIDHCLDCARFAKVVLITNVDLVKNKRLDIEYVQAPLMRSTRDYSDLLLTGIEQYVKGSHVLIIQWDSFITNPHLWREEFLEYDYIGAVWPHHPQNPVGNGGFSLRSVGLLQAMKDPEFIKSHPEDYCICVENKVLLEQEHSVRFAPIEVAEQFAVERSDWHDAFGFHGLFNFAKVLSDENLDKFLSAIPASYLSGVDAYDLHSSLRHSGRFELSHKLLLKIKFKWKMRRRYFRAKLLLINGRRAVKALD